PDLVHGVGMAVPYPKPVPGRGDARGYLEGIAAFDPDAEDGFQADAQHPSGRAGVPGPSPASDVRRRAVDVGGYHVRLDAVALHARLRAAVRDRAEHLEERRRAVTSAGLGHRLHDPECGVRVLASVFAYAGQVPADVAGVVRGAVKRRREQADDAGLLIDQVLLEGIERLARTRFRSRSGEHGPGLREGIDLRLVVLGGAQRVAVVVVG